MLRQYEGEVMMVERPEDAAKPMLSEDYNRSLIESLPIGLALCRMDGTLVDVNQAFADIMGYTTDEVLRLTYWDITPRSYEPQEAEQLQLIETIGRYGPYEKEYIHRKGHLVPVRLKGERITLGGQQYIWSSVEDISDRIEAERVLADSLARAEQASRAKSQFLATMSHELRTPLNAIIGFSDMMHRGIFGPIKPSQYADYADNINKSGKHLLKMISNILDMSKIEAGEFTAQSESIALDDIIDDTVSMLRIRADEEHVDLRVSVPAGLPMALADRQLTKQVLINLLTNAIKFTPEGGSVAVQAATEDDSIRISVRDTGIGLSPENLKRALEPFVQVERENQQFHEGTGLGLPLCVQFVELQGGTLTLESKENLGTTATFTLPISEFTMAGVPTIAEDLFGDYLVWLPSMSVGMDVWDEDHKGLLRCIRKLRESYEGHASQETISDILQTLNRYTETHLHSEENLMLKMSYPHYKHHKNKHDEFRAWMKKMIDAYRINPDQWDGVKASDHLIKWWYSHILTLDMAYKEFFNERQTKAHVYLRKYKGIGGA